MKVYQDIFTDEEIISDSFDINLLFDGACGEVASRYVAKGGVNVDIGKGNQFGGGGEEEEIDDKVEKVIDVVDAFRLNSTSFVKKDYMTYMKKYMKEVKEKLQVTNPGRVEAFQAGATEMVKWILKNFDEFEL